MKLLPRLIIVLLALLVAVCALAQPKSDKVKWSARIEPADVRAGESAQILLTAEIVKDWHIYAMNQPAGPISTAFTLAPNKDVTANGKPIEPKPTKYMDAGFKIELGKHQGSTTFAIPISISKAATGTIKASVSATSQACSNSCEAPATVDIPVQLSIQPGSAREDRIAPVVSVPEQPADHISPDGASASKEGKSETTDAIASQIADAQKAGLLPYFWLSFVFGLLALLTPCVWPMVPITVSFFSKRTGDGQKKNISGALAYCLGIVATFTLLGLVFTLIFGASGIQQLAANRWVNLGLATLFIVLALSLFGLFEFALPASWTTKLQKGSTKGGWVGPVLMGLTFSLTTFTCTVPFVGTILVSATKGDLLYPIVGMVGFSLAFAIPFFFLALFPQFLAKLPRSGSWLSAVKAYMGFLEIAAALKFLSNAELMLELGILTRPVFLALWAAIFLAAALYLFGVYSIGHTGTSPIGAYRKAFAVLTTVIAGYCVAAVFGAPMGQAVGFLPPDPYPTMSKWIQSYDKGIEIAKKDDKLVFINFTGITCTNCRVMESNYFPLPSIKGRLGQMVPVELYTDKDTPESNANAALREKLTGASTNPTYVVMTAEGKVLKVFQGQASSEKDFVSFLDSAASMKPKQ